MERISKVRLKGGFYTEQIDIALREIDKHRVSVIYGNNGSGKSSISDAFYEYKESTDDSFETYEMVSLLDNSSKSLPFNIEEKGNIWVYCDKYIDKNINWEEDNLGAIVMFGELAEIETELKEIQEKQLEASNSRDKIDLDKYDNSKGDYSINFARESVVKQLKQSWAIREKEIKALSRNAMVNDATIEEILATKKTSETISSLRKEFDLKLAEYKKANDNSEKYTLFSLPIFDPNTEKNIQSLLQKKVEKPKGTGVDEKLYKLIKKGQKFLVDSSFEHFSHDDRNECPYCLQTVSPEHKEQLLRSIRSVLNQDVQDHIGELSSLKESLLEIQLELEYLRKLDNEKVTKLLGNVQSYNEHVAKIIESIDNKIENVFEPVENLDLTLKSLGEQIINESESLIESIKAFNIMIDNVNNTKNELLELNKRIALIEISDSYNIYTSLVGKRDSETKSLAKINSEISEFESNISKLKAKKQNVDIALNDINKNLAKIFTDKNRLKLALDNNANYRVTSRGRKIKLKKLSSGEKNVISLCYFFSHLRNNTNSHEKYSEPYFIVLDDPISSLDFDNKVGIYTFLREQLGLIIQNNFKSRIVIFTHDLEAVYKFKNVFDDTRGALKTGEFCCYRKFDYDKNTSDVKPANINSYAWNIDLIYDYANEEKDIVDNADVFIGNVLRKTLEAYSTFNFRVGISQLTQKEKILNKISDEEIREHFKTRMYRLVLHSESHTEETAKSFVDYETFNQFSRAEKINTVKDILCILYLLDSEHVKAYLPNDVHKIQNIEKWINDAVGC